LPAPFFAHQSDNLSAPLPALVPSSLPVTQDVADDLRLELTGFQGHGALWDAFSAIVTSPSSVTSPIVAKLTDIKTFAATLGSTPTGYTAPEARRAIANEIALVVGPLSNLQGKVIPRLHGLLGSLQSLDSGDQAEVWCALYDDVGRIMPDSAKMNVPIR